MINLFIDLQEELGLAYLFIAHDLAVVERIADRVAVMYLGRIVEVAEREEIFRNPLHPYTRALLQAIPIPDPVRARVREWVKGDLPSPSHPPSGCRFHPRCPSAVEPCPRVDPPLLEATPGHWVACHLYPGEGVGTAPDRGGGKGAGAGGSLG